MYYTIFFFWALPPLTFFCFVARISGDTYDVGGDMRNQTKASIEQTNKFHESAEESVKRIEKIKRKRAKKKR